jgi:hypothetical protein
MGFSDTFSFEESEYASKISKYSLTELKKQEVIKHRQHVSASASIGGGIGVAPFTMGLTLIGSAYGGRRLYIASKKLEMIRAELEKREVELYKPTKRDFFIPLGVSMATLGLGAGVDSLASHATSTVAAHVAAQHGTQAVHDAVQPAPSLPTSSVPTPGVI